MSTASLHGAREHARSQLGATAVTQRTIPASDAIGLPADVDASDVIWDETVGPGDYARTSSPPAPCSGSPTSTATPACT